MKTILSIVMLCIGTAIFSQDPFFYSNLHMKGYLNPANTGLDGSLSSSAVFKTQYLKNTPQFSTAGATFEQSFPCFKNRFDLGGYALTDLEGDGYINTNEFAFTGVYNAVLGSKNRNVGNLRMGLTTSYLNKRIDVSRLVFSDQLDAERGNINGSAFQRDQISPVNRINNSVGIAYVARSKARDLKQWRLKVGGSMTRFTEIFQSATSQTLLGNKIERDFFVDRCSFEIDYVFSGNRLKFLRSSLFVNPYSVTTWQSSLMVNQTGVRLNITRFLAPGVGFVYSNFTDVGGDTKALLTELGLNFFDSSKRLFRLDFAYIIELGGLNNDQYNSLQFGIKYVLNKNGCRDVKSKTACFADYGIIYDQFWID